MLTIVIQESPKEQSKYKTLTPYKFFDCDKDEITAETN